MKIDKFVVLNVALITFLLGVIYIETHSILATVVAAWLAIQIELNRYSIIKVQSKLLSTQDMADIKKATQDMAELKKHMNWE